MNSTALLTVLGCRAGSPGQGSAASGYVLAAGGHTILVDCGPGVVLELVRHNLLADLDAVVITHRHADHCVDLVALAYHRLFPARAAPLPLYGPASLQEVLDGLDELFGIASLADLARPLSAAFAFAPLEPGAVCTIAGHHIQTLRTLHPVPTLALRVTETGWVYSSDGACTPQLVRFATGARLLTAEATYLTANGPDLEGHGHMTAAQAGALAQAAGVEQLMLTHFADCAATAHSIQQARSTFDGPVLAAVPGLKVVLS